VAGAVLAPGALGAVAGAHAGPGVRTGVHRGGTGPGGTGDADRVALAALDGRRRPTSTSGGDARWPTTRRLACLAGRPRAAQGAARREGPAAGADLGRAAGSWRGWSSDTDAGRLPAASRPAHLRPGRSHGAPPAPRAGSREPPPCDDGQLTLDFGDQADAGRGTRWCGRGRSPSWPGSLDAELDAGGRLRSAGEVELPLQRTLARMEQVGIALDPTPSGALWADFDAEVRAPSRRRTTPSASRSTSARPSSCRCAVRRAGHAQDPPDPDRLHHRRGRVGGAVYAKTEHPFLAALLRHRDQIRLRQTVEGLQKSIADDGRVHTTYLQTVAATGRLSSTDPNLQNIPIRTEAGRRIREAFVVGTGVRVADDGRLQPDRDADHGPRVRRRRADRGVHASGEDFHTADGRPRVRVAPDGHARCAPRSRR
jgi:DNA polymerase-1